jgi:hypothetical protein
MAWQNTPSTRAVGHVLFSFVRSSHHTTSAMLRHRAALARQRPGLCGGNVDARRFLYRGGRVALIAAWHRAVVWQAGPSATFSTDIDSFDFKMRKPEQVIKAVMSKLEKHGKGIILMHDFRHATAEAMPELLRQLKAAGYKVVHVVPKAPVTTLAKHDDMVRQQDKLSVTNTRPENSVVRTID